MKKGKRYIERRRFGEGNEPATPDVHIRWDRSKEEIWEQLEKRIENEAQLKNDSASRVITLNRKWIQISVAAAVTLFIGLATLVSLYTRSVNVPSGMHAEVLLPDNSLVKMNAQSGISYKPLMWRFNRTLKFEGEAFFEVQKGKKFEVISARGKTTVLGTSFNIYSRDDEYKVTCITGRVSVSDRDGNQAIILQPGYQTSIDAGGSFSHQTEADTNIVVSWLENKLSFTSEPLEKVFREIERQYGITVILPAELNKTYTGTFIKDDSVENVLNLVCRPFELNAVRNSEKEYAVKRNN